MQALTLSVAILGCLSVLSLRPARALAIYMAVVLMYPTFLVVRVGPLDISAARIVVMVLLLRCLSDPKLRRNLRWCRLDSWVAFGAVVAIAIPLLAWKIPAMKALENRSGRLMDTFLAYLVARFCLTDRKAMITAVKWIGIALVPLACLGAVESYTGWQPFLAMKQFCPWLPLKESVPNVRIGLYRAVGPSGNSILFGAVFVVILPLVYCLRHEAGYWRSLSYGLVGLIVIGALSSMSSGPWMMLLIIIGCLALEHFKKWIKPLIVFMVFSCVVVEIISNNSLYRVIASRANPIGGAGWHRARIIDNALEHFGEWWLLGYGGRDPAWGESLGMIWTDITNHYVVAGVEHGLLGVIAICGILTVAILMLVRLHNSVKDPVLRSWYWALGSIIVTLIIVFNAILFSGQAGTLFYVILGMIGSSVNLTSKMNHLQNFNKSFELLPMVNTT